MMDPAWISAGAAFFCAVIAFVVWHENKPLVGLAKQSADAATKSSDAATKSAASSEISANAAVEANEHLKRHADVVAAEFDHQRQLEAVAAEKAEAPYSHARKEISDAIEVFRERIEGWPSNQLAGNSGNWWHQLHAKVKTVLESPECADVRPDKKELVMGEIAKLFKVWSRAHQKPKPLLDALGEFHKEAKKALVP